MHDVAKKFKQNSLKTYKHHRTKGYTYSFGNKPLYGNVNGSSVGLYTNKRNKNYDRQTAINDKAAMLESLCSSSIKNGICHVSKIIPEIKHLKCPIINARYEKQCNSNIELLMKGDNLDDSFWNFFMVVNGFTNNFHT